MAHDPVSDRGDVHDPEQLVHLDVVAAEEVGGLCFGKESTALFRRPS